MARLANRWNIPENCGFVEERVGWWQMNDNPLEDLTLGGLLQQVVGSGEIDVVIETNEGHQSLHYEHIRLTPPNRIDFSSLRDLVIFYYGQTKHAVTTLESDGRHFKLECHIEDTKLTVDCCFNFTGEEHIEIIVT